MAKDSALYKHALTEFRIVGLIGSGVPLPQSFPALALIVVDCFDQYRSRVRNVGSAPLLLEQAMLELPLTRLNPDFNPRGVETVMRLLFCLPLSPLTGEDREWQGRAGERRVNKRCPRVVREPDGTTYDDDFLLDDGTTQRRAVTFPYLPRRKR